MGMMRLSFRLIGFRHFIDGSLALASLNLACRDQVPTFPQRSPPSLFTTAACGGLRPAPDYRSRRALLHLSYSSAPAYSDGASVTHAPSPPWLMPATTIARAPRLLSRAIGASNSARQSKNGRSRLRRCDQHISGVSTRYPAPLIAAASREMVPSGESVLPCMSTTPVVCADTDLPTPATAARVSNVSSSRLILATREKGSGRGLSLNLLPRARGILTAPAWGMNDCGTGVGADGR